MEWFYAKDGKQEGPVDLATLQAKLQGGDLSPSDLIWKEGMAEWTAAENVPEVSGGAAPAAAAPASTGGTLATGGAMATGVSPAPQSPVAHEPIPNFLVPSILVTIFCCWPFGIPAIVFAAKVDGMVARGDIAGARHASKQAKTWTWVSFGCGLVGILLYVGLMMTGVMAEM